jgi:hypothetical protein
MNTHQLIQVNYSIIVGDGLDHKITHKHYEEFGIVKKEKIQINATYKIKCSCITQLSIPCSFMFILLENHRL